MDNNWLRSNGVLLFKDKYATHAGDSEGDTVCVEAIGTDATAVREAERRVLALQGTSRVPISSAQESRFFALCHGWLQQVAADRFGTTLRKVSAVQTWELRQPAQRRTRPGEVEISGGSAAACEKAARWLRSELKHHQRARISVTVATYAPNARRHLFIALRAKAKRLLAAGSRATAAARSTLSGGDSSTGGSRHSWDGGHAGNTTACASSCMRGYERDAPLYNDAERQRRRSTPCRCGSH